ncbi:MAG TPA: glucose-1-phosphate cytidylyltransferase [Egibacteraceae bacterium]|nr:glucose-1-phosphate cytidylyltransferase [Egibacteraceae bacterium]
MPVESESSSARRAPSLQCAILAGGRGTRIAEESHLRPKPMIEIGGRPILWHIMKSYAEHGVSDFVICLGYRGYMIKEYFANYFLHASDVTIDMRTNTCVYHDNRSEPWRVTLVDTGDRTQTGGRIRRIKDYLHPGQPFCLTYGDGLGDVDIAAEIDFHRAHGKLATMTVVQPPARFGASLIDGDEVVGFEEKPQADGGYINGGFFVLEPGVLDLISGDDTVWERGPLERLAAANELAAWRHAGFWQPMDTLREKELLESLWVSGKAPWKTW